ncbi:hypothetical protein [Longimicrobium sp.]|jgi:hypothetical protein|uniref:hypothetical protein n=1 Tax=Longimicrobium sp. TaxID=2029185 RepID=UPI002F94E4EA
MSKIARPGEAWPTGYVFDVPRWRRNVPDSKPWRPFYLLNRVVPGDAATLALMTTKSTEVAHGATQFIVPDTKKLRLPGQDASYIEVSSILVEDSSNFSTASDNLSRHRAAVRAQLHTALGMGEGTGPGTKGESIRGFLVRLTRPMEREFGYSFGIVLTRHEYSRARRLQTVVPVLDLRVFTGPAVSAATFEPKGGLIRPADGTAAWLRQLPPEWAGHVLDVPLLNTFTEEWRMHRDPARWLPRQIEHVYPTPVDDATLAAVEAAVSERLQ